MKQIKPNSNETHEEVKIYKPQPSIIPVYKTYTVTDNYTASNGRVYNKSEENVILSKEETDANHK